MRKNVCVQTYIYTDDCRHFHGCCAAVSLTHTCTTHSIHIWLYHGIRHTMRRNAKIIMRIEYEYIIQYYSKSEVKKMYVVMLLLPPSFFPLLWWPIVIMWLCVGRYCIHTDTHYCSVTLYGSFECFCTPYVVYTFDFRFILSATKLSICSIRFS